MKSRPHPRAAEVFGAVVAVPPAERPAVLDRECAEDPSLRREIVELLAHDELIRSAEALGGLSLERPPIASVESVVDQVIRAADAERLENALYEHGAIVDQYTVVRPIGAGGFGVVYLAQQAPPEQRRVALKILEGLPNSRRVERRFERERRAQARMDHPGVARIYSGGVTDRGHPYFAMEFITGESVDRPAAWITEYADAHRLTTPERIELLIQVCLAVEHAHQKGIIHRDLKPSNILVAIVDGRAIPKVIDFGIARAVSGDGLESQAKAQTSLTLREEILGTPAYMSPEQAASAQVDTLTDVYSLGVVLYELLCGAPPFPFEWESGSLSEHYRVIREVDPTRPSKALLKNTPNSMRIAHARTTTVGTLTRQLRGDLDHILSTVLEKAPARRYQSADALAEDLQRHLASQPIRARPPKILYTLSKLSRRHRSVVAAATVATASLVVATIVSLKLMFIAQDAEATAISRSGVAEIFVAQYALALDDGGKLRRHLDLVPNSARKWEWEHLNFRSDRSATQLGSHSAQLSALAVSTDGQRMISGGRDGTVMSWDIETRTGSPLPIPTRQTGGVHDAWSVAISSNGDRIAAGSFDGTVRIWTGDGTLLSEFKDQGGVLYRFIYAVAFSPDGRWLAIGSGGMQPQGEGIVAIRDIETGQGVSIDRSSHSQPVMDLAFSTDGQMLASASDDHTVRLWRVGQGILVPDGDPIALDGQVNAVALAPDGSMLAAGMTKQQTIELISLPSRQKLDPLVGHRGELASLAFSADGTKLASGSWDSTIRIWSMPEGHEISILRGHRGRVNRVTFTSDGRLFSASNDGSLREWVPPFEADVPVLFSAHSAIESVCFLSEGRLAAACAEGVILWDDKTRQTTVLSPIPTGPMEASPDGTTLAWLGVKCVNTWRADVRLVRHECSDLSGAFRFWPMDDRRIAVPCRSGMMCLDFMSGTWTRVQTPTTGPGLDESAVQPELFSGWFRDPDRAPTMVWRHAKGAAVEGESGWRIVQSSATDFSAVGASSTGWGIFTEEHNTVTLLEPGLSKLSKRLTGHTEKVRRAAISPDSSRLVSVSDDDTLRIWDIRRSEEVLQLDHPAKNQIPGKRSGARFTCVAWSRDGRTIATGSTNGDVHVWNSRAP